MKLRCPYCQTEFEPTQATACCPQCNKVMVIPPAVRLKLGLGAPRRERIRPVVQADVPGRAPRLLLGRFLTRTRVTIWCLFFIVMGVTVALKWQHRTTHQALGAVSLAAAEVNTLGTALEYFAQHCGRYPTERERLLALISNPNVDGWRGPYVTGLKPDPWGRPYGYTVTSSNAVVFSLGEDGTRGTADDIEAACPALAAP
jgi:general secretion pathway protein G